MVSGSGKRLLGVPEDNGNKCTIVNIRTGNENKQQGRFSRGPVLMEFRGVYSATKEIRM